MNFLDIVLAGFGVAADAAAVAVCDGLAVKNLNKGKKLFIALSFGIFQGIMPLIGFFVSSVFYDAAKLIAPYLSFILLTVIGSRMIYESLKEDSETVGAALGIKEIIIQAAATSVDAMAVGISMLAMESIGRLDVNIFAACAVFASVTFAMSYCGVAAGGKLGRKIAGRAETVGGAVIIFIGIKIFIESFLKKYI